SAALRIPSRAARRASTSPADGSGEGFSLPPGGRGEGFFPSHRLGAAKGLPSPAGGRGEIGARHALTKSCDARRAFNALGRCALAVEDIMKGTLALFDVAGYAALLLWGTQMVTRVYLRILRDLQRVHSHLAAIA